MTISPGNGGKAVAPEAASRGESAALLAAGLAEEGAPDRAVEILTGLPREALRAAVAKLARMAIDRDAEVFPQGDKDKPELAPDWPAC